MKELMPVMVNQSKMYSLLKDDSGALYLEVVCGGIALEAKVVKLNDAETKRVEVEGKGYVDSLARKISRDRLKYRDRFLKAR